MTGKKAAVRVMRFNQLKFSPRFEYGEMAQVVEICGVKDGTDLGAGWGRLTNALIPWTIQYDEVLTVVEGVLKLHTDGKLHELAAKDCIWLPSGTELIYEANSALIHFSIHPSNWHQKP